MILKNIVYASFLPILDVEVPKLSSKLLNLGLNLNPAINGHPGVSQAETFINVCAVPWMNVKRMSCLPELVGRY